MKRHQFGLRIGQPERVGLLVHGMKGGQQRIESGAGFEPRRDCMLLARIPHVDGMAEQDFTLQRSEALQRFLFEFVKKILSAAATLAASRGRSCVRCKSMRGRAVNIPQAEKSPA